LEIFQVIGRNLKHIDSITVGMEPIAVAIRNNNEVWVVNHLSDSVSIVNVQKPGSRRVVQTLLVGDEPRDIIFAGPNKSRAFITTAHRGQNIGFDPQLTTPGIGRADVWVFDTGNLGNSLGGKPMTVLTLFTDTPRALATTPDGSTVYAAGFHTGNRTTTLNEFIVKKGIALPTPTRIYPGPLTNYANILQPSVGLIVQFNGQHWVDELGQQWDDMVPFSLPDRDVFTINANSTPPAVNDAAYTGVGTVLFNMIVNPVSGHIYVSNTEAQNQDRFEGKGIFSQGQTVRGHLHESRITVLGGNPLVQPRHLNKHIDYSTCCASIPNKENDTSVAFPQDMAITKDGEKLYVAAFGTSEVAVYDTNALENDSFVPNTANQIHVTGGGPSGVALNEGKSLLYVLTRFDNAISVIDTESRKEIKHVAMFNPEPKHIVEGRPFLYDASFSSSHGDSACASCHVFGDFDSLAWDLGDPDGDQATNTGPFKVPEGIGFFLGRGRAENPHFRPMKGPMTTQSLRGMDNHGSMHWRGDRTGGNDANLLPNAGVNVQPNGGSFNEDVAFRKFNVAFPGLNGRHQLLSDKDMRKFSKFILEITYPPNPIRNLDNSMTPAQQAGHDFFLTSKPSDSFFECTGCHVLDRNGNKQYPSVKKPGFFGTDGQFSFEGESQFFKIPHLRNLYQKVGMFGMALPPAPSQPPFDPSQVAPLLGSAIFAPFANNGPMGEQVRGFGFTHDGSVDTPLRFVSISLFSARPPGSIPIVDPINTPEELLVDGKDPGNSGGLPPFAPTPEAIAQGIPPRRNIEAFLFAFDSNMMPIVGQQVTLNAYNATEAEPRIDLLIARADEKDCDLIAKNRQSGFLYVGEGEFKPSLKYAPKIHDVFLRASALKSKGEVTYTCVPPGSGKRLSVDRDADGVLDNDDRHDNLRH